MDIAHWVRCRRWRALLELIDQLPAASRFREAVANDPEQARLAIEREDSADPDEEAEPWSPRVSDWTLEAVLLRQIREGLVSVFQQLVASGGRTPPHVEAFPVPRTAVDRAREEADVVWAMGLMRQLTPHLFERRG